jgi:hypothetical protein
MDPKFLRNQVRPIAKQPALCHLCMFYCELSVAPNAVLI